MDWQTNYKDLKRQRDAMVGKDEIRLIEKRDLVHIAILAAIALVIGVYLIATTVLIAKDGVGYIERAQQLPKDPISIIKRHPPGYPFLILVTHKLVTLFSNGSSVQGWIYSAQGITLLCRLLALIPLYLIGKLLVGSKNSFLAILILVILPHSAKYCAEVLREWPYILLLATGLFFLLWGAKSGRWWVFGLVGLSAGLGYLIRHESAQLVVYGFLWVAISMFRPKLWGMSRCRILTALALLLIGFAIPAVPYMKCTGRIVPPKVNRIMKSFSFNALPDETDEPKINTVSLNYNTAEIIPRNVLKALGAIFKTIGESLMWFFMLPWVIGLYYRFRGNAEYAELFCITVFMLLNVTMMVLRYSIISEHASQRWSLPLITFTVFYIPAGLTIIARHLENIFQRNLKKTGTSNKKCLPWFLILLLIGIGICLPKLLRPIGIKKKGYRKVAKWLNQNTHSDDIIAGGDIRINFYAGRVGKEMQIARSTISGGKIRTDDWVNIVGTFDRGYQRLYINGTLTCEKKTLFSDLCSGEGDLTIGKSHGGSRSYFKGILDEVAIYSRALRPDEIRELYDSRMFATEDSGMIGGWTLDRDAVGINGKPNTAMNFNGIGDSIDLSDYSSRLNNGPFSISVWTKPELLDRMNWIVGNGAQFHIGIRNSKVYFWIRERPPGHEIPADAAYVITSTNERTNELNATFNKPVQKKNSVWINKREKKKRIVIYKVL